MLKSSIFGDDGSTIMMTVLSSGAQAALTSFSVGPAFGPNRVKTRIRQSVRLNQRSHCRMPRHVVCHRYYNCRSHCPERYLHASKCSSLQTPCYACLQLKLFECLFQLQLLFIWDYLCCVQLQVTKQASAILQAKHLTGASLGTLRDLPLN